MRDRCVVHALDDDVDRRVERDSLRVGCLIVEEVDSGFAFAKGLERRRWCVGETSRRQGAADGATFVCGGVDPRDRETAANVVAEHARCVDGQRRIGVCGVEVVGKFRRRVMHDDGIERVRMRCAVSIGNRHGDGVATVSRISVIETKAPRGLIEFKILIAVAVAVVDGPRP